MFTNLSLKLLTQTEIPVDETGLDPQPEKQNEDNESTLSQDKKEKKRGKRSRRKGDLSTGIDSQIEISRLTNSFKYSVHYIFILKRKAIPDAISLDISNSPKSEPKPKRNHPDGKDLTDKVTWVFELLALSKKELLYRKEYKTLRGARIAFMKLYGRRLNLDLCHPAWTKFYKPEPGWVENLIQLF